MCDPVSQVLVYTYSLSFTAIFILGWLVFLSDTRKLMNRVFFLLTIAMSLWLVFDLLSWTRPEDTTYGMLAIIGAIIPSIFLYFSYVFPEESTISAKKALLVFLPSLPYIVLAPTKFNVQGVDLSTPSCDLIVGPLYDLIVPVSLGYLAWAFFVLRKKLKSGNHQVKSQIKWFFGGFAFFLISSLVTNVVAPMFHWDFFSPMTPFGILVLAGTIAYAILKYQFLDIKIVASQFATFVIWLLIALQAFFVQSGTGMVLAGFTFLFSLGFGIILIRSVQKQVEMAKILEAANRELQQLDKAKSEFIDIASHQLRTPISVITMLDDGSMEGFKPEDIKKFYKSALFKCRKLEDIVEDILNANALSDGTFRVGRDTADEIRLRPFFEKVVGELDPEVRERELTLTLEPVDDALVLRGDARYLEEAFNNLINNAIKYTPSRKATPDVRSTRDGDGVIVVRAGRDPKRKGRVLVRISDNGIGIPEEALPDIFKKFRRADNARNMYTDGSGLGLFIVREIIEGHGGDIRVESEVGKGTTFLVSLPLDPPSAVDIERHIFEAASREVRSIDN
jgi:signal transduction histidine kinase